MTNFWPEDINVNDIASPHQILDEAKTEWEEQSNAVLTLVFQDTESEDGNPMIIVHAKHLPSQRSSTLMEIIHRPGKPYPLRIQPRIEEPPAYLTHSLITPTSPQIAASTAVPDAIASRRIDNKWVCDTPSELREKLRTMFNLSGTKSEIIILLSGSATSYNEPIDDAYRRHTIP